MNNKKSKDFITPIVIDLSKHYEEGSEEWSFAYWHREEREAINLLAERLKKIERKLKKI